MELIYEGSEKVEVVSETEDADFWLLTQTQLAELIQLMPPTMQRVSELFDEDGLEHSKKKRVVA
jgi:hypothetical protein